MLRAAGGFGLRMRFILNVSIHTKEFNDAVRDGSAGRKLKSILDDLRPEAAYFTDHHGERSAVLIVDVAEASQIPSLAEPWFLAFNASVEFKAAMTPEDLAKAGLDELGKKWA